jgi:His/Glu/Gln/Arg/opine family amino acid ABC transporter permease subunit
MQFEFDQVVRNWPVLLHGLAYTAVLSLSIFAAGIAGGMAVCYARIQPRASIQIVARIYIGLFRAVPEMVLLFWAYYCLPIILGVETPAILTGVAGLSIVASAYLAEIFRAGVGAVPRAQFEAGRAIGLPETLIWRKIAIPQILPVVAAPMVNCAADTVKNTTLLAAIGVPELVYNALSLGSQTFRYFEFVTAIGVGFFAIIFPLSLYARSKEAIVAARGRCGEQA